MYLEFRVGLFWHCGPVSGAKMINGLQSAISCIVSLILSPKLSQFLLLSNTLADGDLQRFSIHQFHPRKFYNYSLLSLKSDKYLSI